jgi:hypothetical protein
MAFPVSYAPGPSHYDFMPYRRCDRSGLKQPAITLGEMRAAVDPPAVLFHAQPLN